MLLDVAKLDNKEAYRLVSKLDDEKAACVLLDVAKLDDEEAREDVSNSDELVITRVLLEFAALDDDGELWTDVSMPEDL